jgi:hypothetical protein
MASKRNDVIKAINKAYPELNLGTTEEFNGSTNGIWVRGTEDDLRAKDEFNLFDYYNEDYNEKRYVFGVHKDIRNIVEPLGWFFEWNDPGTIMIWEA